MLTEWAAGFSQDKIDAAINNALLKKVSEVDDVAAMYSELQPKPSSRQFPFLRTTASLARSSRSAQVSDYRPQEISRANVYWDERDMCIQ